MPKATKAKASKAKASKAKASKSKTSKPKALASKAQAAMPPMLAYTITSPPWANSRPGVNIGAGRNRKSFWPDNPVDDSYWIVILDANNPLGNKVKEWVIPASGAAVPAGIATYMDNPAYIFAVVSQYLNTLHVPQGAFYDFLAKYGASRELQKLEQLSAVLSCGSYGRMSYILTGQCGPRTPYPPPSYEIGSYTVLQSILMMSLMPKMNGSPPYTICDSYTWK